MTKFKTKSPRKIQYSQSLLNFCQMRDNAIVDKQYYYTNKHSSISFTCKCGEKHTKKFQTIYIYGGMRCKNCTTKEKTRKTLKTFEISGRKRFTKDSIIKFLKDNEIPITKLNNKDITNMETDIPIDVKRIDMVESICKHCSNTFTKTLRRLTQIKEAICYSCVRNHSNNYNIKTTEEEDQIEI